MRLSRRDFCLAGAAIPAATAAAAPPRPNVILIITDDQGYPDLGAHGNPHLKTPHLDRLAAQSVQFSNFCVSPLCAPTRASLITGRYYYRTGITDTYKGRAIMDPRESTLAEMLRRAGYRTGIFGKWHLGDCYPTRPIDKGFDEELVHLGGGLAQPSATREDGGYFNPRLRRNGRFEKTSGYCTDIFTNAALSFIEQNHRRPFFVYLPTNAPHDPYLVDERYSAPYHALGLPKNTANIYGMIANLDENIGRLLSKLDELKIADNTIFIFMTDNGATNATYTAGLRNLKASVYEGGIKSPLFVRWPARLKPAKVDRLSAMIDLTPTLLEACSVPAPKNIRFDGRSLLPLLENPRTNVPERTIFIQIHRGDAPDRFRNFCVRTQRWKLLHNVPIARPNPPELRFELFDLLNDPGEKNNVIAQHPDIAAQLNAAYEAWFADVTATRGFAPVRFIVGTPREPVTELTRQDWRGDHAEWNDPLAAGYWEIEVQGRRRFDIELRFPPFAAGAEATLQFQSLRLTMPVAANAASCTFANVRLPAGPGRLEPILRSATESRGAHFVILRQR